MILPLTLWKPKAFAEKTNNELYAQGIYSGLIGGMIVYNLFIFFTIRERSYLFYVLFLSFFMGYQLSLQGLAQQYLWPETVGWENRSIAINGALAVFFGILFSIQFLELKQNHRRFYLAGLGLLGFTGIAMLLSVFAPYRAAIMTVTPMGGLAVIYAIVTGTVSTASGYKPARYFLVAWLMLVVGTVLQSLRAYGLVPSNFMTGHSMQIGSAMEALLLSLALAARIRTMKAKQEKAQREALESMQRMDRLKDEFLANTSHELRTPINGMTGLAEGMLKDTSRSLTPEDHQNLAMIVSSGRRLNSLVNDILDFSKLQNQDLALSKKPVDIKALTDVVLTLLRPLAEDKGLSLKNRIPEDVFPIFADEARLQQIMHNLVGNAIKFTAKGYIAVSADTQGEYLAIHIEDTGIGIPSDRVDSIFESFNQGDGSIAREYGGTGLGLSITRQMVELHGGEIRVASTPGKGSVFTFSMPICDEAEPTEARENPPGLTTTPTESGLPKGPSKPLKDGPVLEGMNLGHLLIVDDEPVNRQVLRKQLTSVGYTVSEAANGDIALSMINESNEFALVLLDVMMPRISGYEVCRKIRQKYTPEELPVIVLTARNQEEASVSAFRCGANDYLSKPFVQDELLARTAIHLNLSRSYQEMTKRNRELQVLMEANKSLEEISHTDALTGVKNRRYFETRFKEEVNRAQRSQTTLSIMIMDIDHFKSFNDNYGHAAGDRCLQAVAKAMMESVTRPYDVICRYGGEEFVVLLPDTEEEGAKCVAERIRANIAKLVLTLDGENVRVTISIGVNVTTPNRFNDPDTLLEQADEALYRAKENGRNRVEVAEQTIVS